MLFETDTPQPPLRRLALVCALASCALLACGSDEGESGDVAPTSNGEVGDVSREDGLTWSRDIKPMIDANCVSCHSAGGVGPFELSSYAAFKPMAATSMASIHAGTMPPWMPEPDCREFKDQRILTAEQISNLEAWIDLGMPEGDPADAPATQEQGLTFEATHTGQIADPYMPDVDKPDDYRCFVLDFEFEQDMFMTGSLVVPDAKALVHHVLVYAITPDQLGEVLAADAEEAGPGYTCFGAPFPSSGGGGLGGGIGAAGLPTQVGTWVPGNEPAFADPGTSTRITKGSKIVMQVHYNTLVSPPTLDATGFQMILQDEPTPMLTETRPLLILNLDIPAGDPEAVNTNMFRNYTDTPITINRVAGHMHLLGKSLHSEITRVDGSQECVLDIPRWDFSWQQSYEPMAPIVLQPGDAISLECRYDNSPANQPVVNGQAVEPRDVTWGEGTLDEMCMMYMSLVEPYTETPDPNAPTCAGADACLAACPEGTSQTDCLLGCDLSMDCVTCSLQELLGCTDCIGTLLAARACFTNCAINAFILGGSLGACLQDECNTEYNGMLDCIDPEIEAGACDDGLSACGITR